MRAERHASVGLAGSVSAPSNYVLTGAADAATAATI
jgi:hypothetical protein